MFTREQADSIAENFTKVSNAIVLNLTNVAEAYVALCHHKMQVKPISQQISKPAPVQAKPEYNSAESYFHKPKPSVARKPVSTGSAAYELAEKYVMDLYKKDSSGPIHCKRIKDFLKSNGMPCTQGPWAALRKRLIENGYLVGKERDGWLTYGKALTSAAA